MQSTTPKYTILAFLKLSFFLVLIQACQPRQQDASEDGKSALPPEKNMVETMVLARQDFAREIISNGKLAAIKKAALYFKTQGILETIGVKNGQQVEKGAEIASLQNQGFLLNLKKLKLFWKLQKLKNWMPC